MKKYHNENLKEKILDETLKIIRIEGIESLSTRKLGLSLAVSSAAIYRHYTSIDGLFSCAVIEESINFARYLFSEIKDEEKPILKILEVSKSFVDYAVKEPNMFDLLFLSKYSAKFVKPDQDSEYDTLKQMSLLVKEFRNYYNSTMSEEYIFTQFWSFIFGYAVLIRKEALKFDENIVESLILKYI